MKKERTSRDTGVVQGGAKYQVVQRRMGKPIGGWQASLWHMSRLLLSKPGTRMEESPKSGSEDSMLCRLEIAENQYLYDMDSLEL